MVNIKFTIKPYRCKLYKREIKNLSKILIKNKKIHILSDDIYEHITYDKAKFFTIAQISI